MIYKVVEHHCFRPKRHPVHINLNTGTLRIRICFFSDFLHGDAKKLSEKERTDYKYITLFEIFKLLTFNRNARLSPRLNDTLHMLEHRW